jgi:hypothetical protein
METTTLGPDFGSGTRAQHWQLAMSPTRRCNEDKAPTLPHTHKVWAKMKKRR